MRVLVDSNVLFDYDQGLAIAWREEKVQEGWRIYISEISVMEALRGIAGKQGSRRDALRNLRSRIEKMRSDRKIRGIFVVDRVIMRKAKELLKDYCEHRTPPPSREKMQALICDMIIAATILIRKNLILIGRDRHFEWIAQRYSFRFEIPDYMEPLEEDS